MKATLYVKETFSAAHFLPGYDGPCSTIHGHTWRVEVWLKGDIDPETGMVADFRQVRELIKELDHPGDTLNEVLPWRSGIPPTAENIALYLLGLIPNCHRLRLWESDNCYAEVCVDDIPSK